MPTIMNYETVLAQMRSQEFKCHYYNSGAFGFPDAANAQTRAWVGPADSTIRAEARSLTRAVGDPYESNLAKLATELWQRHALGRVWVMPKSHWAFELGHGSREWMPALMEQIDVDFTSLENLTNAAAIEFAVVESRTFERLIAGLLTHLHGSDFMIAFPGRSILCTLHHHKQLWWTTTEPDVIQAIERLPLAV